MISAGSKVHARIGAMAAALTLGGCAYEIGYHEEYLPQEPPAYVAQGKLLVVMPEEQRTFLYEGSPSSQTGDYTTLTVPIGSMQEFIYSYTKVIDAGFNAERADTSV
jgi:hypothetical protein